MLTEQKKPRIIMPNSKNIEALFTLYLLFLNFLESICIVHPTESEYKAEIETDTHRR